MNKHRKRNTAESGQAMLILLGTYCLGAGFLTAQNETVQGTLTVEDDVILEDHSGTPTADAKLRFAEGSTNEFSFWQTTVGDFLWGHDTSIEMMLLDKDHILRLYDDGGSNAERIVLNPGDGTAGSAKITIDGVEVLNDAGSFLLEGTFGGSGSIPTSGAGTRMMWYPENAAFRAGRVTGTDWDDSNVGDYSAAFGYNTEASGNYSLASGYYSEATGFASTALGWSYASGSYSSALGGGHASAQHASALGYGFATDDFATSLGNGTASGKYSLAVGLGEADGDYSMAVGWGDAYGRHSTAYGYAVANGNYSMAIGDRTEVTSYGSLVIGQYNEDHHDSTDSTTIDAAKTAWQGDDEHSVFEIGIGTSTTAENAFTVFQDGSICIGRVQGDVSMGVFGN